MEPVQISRVTLQTLSPNCGPRRDGLRPTLIVIHYTAMKSAEAAIERLCDPAAEVSAHYVIANTGDVTQLVDEDMRAWHAGAGCWHGQDDINSRSIGIELDNDSTHPFSEPLMHSLEILLPKIMTRWKIAAEGVIGHSDFAPGRKTDPGPRFDWARLAKQNLAAKAAPKGCTSTDFTALAEHAGYDTSVAPDDLLQSVRLRWNPTASGPLSPKDHAVFKG
jgi:N-acetylmuramoyl-L-alanine amidase